METKLKMIEILEQQDKGVHLRELSRMLKSGLPNVVRYIKILEKENVIEKKKYANTLNIKLKESVKTIAYLKQVNTERFIALPRNVQMAIKDFLDEIEVKPLISVIFGSYAKNNYTKESDLDLLLVYQKVENEKSIENISKRISMRTNTKISPIYLKYKDFKRNFLSKKHDFSKEAVKNAIVLSGAEIYYPLIWEVLK